MIQPSPNINRRNKQGGYFENLSIKIIKRKAARGLQTNNITNAIIKMTNEQRYDRR